MHPVNPRRVAFDILLRIETENSYADILLDHALSRLEIHGPDRGLLTELVYGVLRHRATLDHIAGQFATTKPGKMERAVLILLRLGLYQSLFLERIPISAAVNETVKLAKTLAPRAAGFINAVLREADRRRASIIYPDRQREPVDYLAARYSHPAWLVREWLAQLGLDEAEQLADAMSAHPPLTIRANTLKTTRDNLALLLQGKGIEAQPTTYAPHGIQLKLTSSPAMLPEFQEGLYTIQDESSQLAALLLDPQPGERVLDVCAAPGGKTTYLAELMGNRGEIVACDLSSKRLRLVADTAIRLGTGIVRTEVIDATRQLDMPVKFDRILVDAPCSGLGVLRRNPEGKWRKRPEDLATLSRTQQTILANAATVLAPGGVLLYATCSTSIVENEQVLDNFLSAHGGFMLEQLHTIFPRYATLFTDRGCFRSWPHRHGMDGFFAARIRKR